MFAQCYCLSGELKLTIDGRGRDSELRVGKLNDGRWHQIDIIQTGKVPFLLFLNHLDHRNLHKYLERKHSCNPLLMKYVIANADNVIAFRVSATLLKYISNEY